MIQKKDRKGYCLKEFLAEKRTLTVGEMLMIMFCIFILFLLIVFKAI